ncbi:hypothetical protein ABZ820_38675 [Streptomyces diacarni]|uniref:hypothetical protein n=1 Tax=Streptomyces diacarni TaxID=2800381 RepID=UPI0033FCD2B8
MLDEERRLSVVEAVPLHQAVDVAKMARSLADQRQRVDEELAHRGRKRLLAGLFGS